MRYNRSFQNCSPIAAEARVLVRSAAEPVPAGETIKGQLRRACRALGYPDGYWRVRAAWYGEAGDWSARALDDLRDKYWEWKAKQDALAATKKETAARVFEALASKYGDEGHEVLDRETSAELRNLVGKLSR